VPNIRQGNLVLLADHNSVLDPALDQHPPAILEASHNVKAREKELSAYLDLKLMDAWTLVHDVEMEVEDNKGLTREHRRIDRISIDAELAPGLAGI